MVVSWIVNDLECVGDLVKNVVKWVIVIDNDLQSKKLVIGVEYMMEFVFGQFKQVLDVYVIWDVEVVCKVQEVDVEVDVIYMFLFCELFIYMMEDLWVIMECVYFFFCVKNIEWIGDYVINIVENVFYMVMGEWLLEDCVKMDEIGVV